MSGRARSLGVKLVTWGLLVVSLDAPLTAASGTRSAALEWYDFEPIVVPDTATGPVSFRAKVTGSFTALQLELQSGSVTALSHSGGDVWTASLSAADVLGGYGANDVNKNFIGFLVALDGTTQLFRANMFAMIGDGNIPTVVAVQPAPDVVHSCHVVNIHHPNLTYPVTYAALQALTQRFYQLFADDFDFLNVVFSGPSYPGNRFHRTIKNDVLGIGLTVFDGSAGYGSAGRLKGLNQYPLAGYFDLAETASVHELGHQWINHSTFTLLATGPHWPPGTQARGVMGYGVTQGLRFPYDLVPLGGGIYRMDAAPELREFTDLDLYLMGLVDPSAVGSNFVFSDPGQAVCPGCSGPVTTFTIADVIAAQGPRIPDTANAQRDFRVATIVATRDRLLTQDELAYFDHFALRGEATTPLPFHLGFEVGTTKPFYVATGGLASLNTALSPGGFCAEEFCLGTVCPCGNVSPSAGCLNSTGHGSLLVSGGEASVSQDTLSLYVVGATPGELGIFVQNVSTFSGTTFYDGRLCLSVDGHLVRHYAPPAVQPSLINAQGFGLNAQPLTIGDYLGDTWPGAKVYYQFWYRDGTGPCTTGANFSSGLAVTWRP